MQSENYINTEYNYKLENVNKRLCDYYVSKVIENTSHLNDLGYLNDDEVLYVHKTMQDIVYDIKATSKESLNADLALDYIGARVDDILKDRAQQKNKQVNDSVEHASFTL